MRWFIYFFLYLLVDGLYLSVKYSTSHPYYHELRVDVLLDHAWVGWWVGNIYTSTKTGGVDANPCAAIHKRVQFLAALELTFLTLDTHSNYYLCTHTRVPINPSPKVNVSLVADTRSSLVLRQRERSTRLASNGETVPVARPSSRSSWPGQISQTSLSFAGTRAASCHRNARNTSRE